MKGGLFSRITIVVRTAVYPAGPDFSHWASLSSACRLAQNDFFLSRKKIKFFSKFQEIRKTPLSENPCGVYRYDLVCALRFWPVNRLKLSFDSFVAMKLARESAYAIEGLLVLAAKPVGSIMLLHEIAKSRRIPESFLAKIFQKLARAGIVASSRGRIRGYALARPAKQISVGSILLAVEGADVFDRCIFWSDRCSDSNPCPLHDCWAGPRQKMVHELMERSNLAELSRKSAR